jgi:hypothetical protein
LPEPEQTEAAGLLREYVGVRIRGVIDGKPEDAIARSESLHEQLWSKASSAAEKKPTPITSLFIQSLNQLIDMHAKRLLVGIHNRIPIPVWACLYGLSMLGMAAVGYQAALTTTRRSPAMLGLVLAFAFLLFLINDLDRGQQGMIQVSQRSLLELQKSMRPAQE